MDNVKQLQQEIADLQAVLDSAKKNATDLEAQLRETIDAKQAERLAIGLQAQRTVSANLKTRIEAKCAELAAAEKSEHEDRMKALRADRLALAGEALGELKEALGSLDRIMNVSVAYSEQHWLARNYPDTSVTQWRNRRDTLDLLIQQLEKDIA